MIRKKIISILIFSVSIPCLLKAQGTPPPSYHVQFRVIGWDAPIMDVMYAATTNNLQSMMITPFSKTGFYDYIGPDPIIFGYAKQGPDGKPLLEKRAAVSLKEFKDRTLLIFKNDQKDPKNLSVSVIDDSDSSVPPGGYKFINLSPKPVNIVCGNSKGMVLPGGGVTLNAQMSPEAQLIPVELFVATPTGSKPVYSNRWPYSKNSRTIVFISYETNTSAYLVKRMQEDVAAIPTPTPAPSIGR